MSENGNKAFRRKKKKQQLHNFKSNGLVSALYNVRVFVFAKQKKFSISEILF